MAAALPILIPIGEAVGAALLASIGAAVVAHQTQPGISWWSALGVGGVAFIAKLMPANVSQATGIVAPKVS